jgi:DNA-binding transcriptional MerR regulator/effector-binding domain-containing protein
MIKIGDFARLSQVSIVALRHYDEIGLLKPIAVDGTTGYRYYSAAQLPKLNRILALKDLGFSLEQIDHVLSGGITLDQLRGMLKLKQAEVERQLAEEQGRLARIAARLRKIELEDTMADYDVVLKTIPPILIASRRVTIPTNDQVPVYLDKAYGEVYRYVKARGARDTGPCFALWHQSAEVLANEIAEAAVPIDRPLPGTKRVEVYELPQARVASAVHHGAFQNFTRLHAALLEWMDANGYNIVGPYREIYIQHDPHNMAESAVEIQYPIEKAS